jgi:hypothetical protein
VDLVLTGDFDGMSVDFIESNQFFFFFLTEDHDFPHEMLRSTQTKLSELLSIVRYGESFFFENLSETDGR